MQNWNKPMADNCVQKMHHNKLKITILITNLLTIINTHTTITMDSVHLHRTPNHTHIVFDLPKPIKHTLNKLTDPNQIIINLMDTDLTFNMSTLNYKNNPIENIHINKHENKTQIIFDLSATVHPHTNLLKPINPHS